MTGSDAPRLEGGRLLVDGKPWLILGGELHNSSGSTGRFMASRWEGIVQAGCNTVLAPITWEQFEPAEGGFDPTALDELLAGARAHDLRLVLLWFGSWKNGVSSYVPSWVKSDPERFGRQHLAGVRTSVLSPFVTANVEADARAFARLMALLREKDSEHTVLMVQVENEVGSLGDSRDRSPAAEIAWAGPFLDDLLKHVRQDPDGCATLLQVSLDSASGETPTWAEAFGVGDATDELFMAWYLARYVNQVAAAGKAEYDLPLYVNAWLNWESGGPGSVTGGARPGSYPSGGPLPHVAAAWHAAAPAIDFMAPDIYAPNPGYWLSRFGQVCAAAFVPELHRGHQGMQTVFLAIGEHGAIGTAPFGIDELSETESRHLRRAYQQLAAISEDILAAQITGSIRGFVVEAEDRIDIDLSHYRFTIGPDRNFSDPDIRPDTGYGLLVMLDSHTFLTCGYGFILSARELEGKSVVLSTVHELDVDPATGRAGDLPILRWLNGDETLSGYAVRVTGDEVGPWPGEIPASGSVTGLIRFSLLPGSA